jgi:ATP-dependent exoDNAse (exonuclease V) beta subunit
MLVSRDLPQPVSAGPAWTAEQLRAIERRSGDLLLDAAAGSGKTSVLVERFARAVLDDGIAVAAILTITFTEKAAAELRDRIRARLRELGAVDQARATEGAFISTIHGFCARVLRAGALTAGLDPNFVVLDGARSEPLAAAAFEDALLDISRRSGPGAIDLVADYQAGALRAAVRAVYGQLRSRGQVRPRLPEVGPDPGPGRGAELAAAARALAGEFGQIGDPSGTVVTAIGRVERCQELLASGEDWPGEFEAVRLPLNGSALSTDACNAYRDALEGHRAACAMRVARPVRDLLDELLASFGHHYAERKRAVSGVDFEDLELLTRELLATRPELRERYAARFARIMVDEFQDTNRVQLELIESISSGNLFTVGDAQQAIYRFRHADVELFERRGAKLAELGQRETLRTNFRSRPAILDALNVGFEEVLGGRFRPLVAARAGEDLDLGPEPYPLVELLLVDKGAEWENDGGLGSPWRTAEARALAARVAQLVESGTRPGDIVVLIRATTDMRAYERALEQHGLPTYVIGGRGYWSHPQVLDLVAYLRTLANPRDEESLYATLASPLVGASLDAIVVLAGAARERARDPWWVLQDPGDALDECSESDRDALGTFAAWCGLERARVARSGVEDLIERALTATGYDLTILAMPGGRRRLANIRKLTRLGRKYEAEHGPDLRGFLDLVAERKAGGGADARESEAPVEGEGLDAVRLMTIHRAKGLEFHTVCVADLGRSVRPPHEVLRVSDDGGLGIRLARSGTAVRVSALDYDAIGAEHKAAEESEEKRLFYVAMTRARERLILSGATRFAGWAEGRSEGGGPVVWIARAFVPDLAQRIADGGGVVENGAARVQLRIWAPEDAACVPDGAVARPASAGADGPLALAPEPAVVRAGAGAPPVATLSYSSLGEYARCGYRFYAERVLGLPPGPEADAGGAEAGTEARARAPRSAADRGVLLHALLEHLDFRRPSAPDGAEIVASAERLGLEPVPGPDEIEELGGLIARFGASELCARLSRAGEARREQRFAFPVGPVMAIGMIDVIAREMGGGMLIVDYKSDRLDGADPELVVQRDYATQRLLYALAALHAGATSVEVAHCFLERPESPATVRFMGAGLEALEAELEELAAGVLRREFSVSETPHRRLCAGCPAEGGLCSWPLEATRREALDRLF